MFLTGICQKDEYDPFSQTKPVFTFTNCSGAKYVVKMPPEATPKRVHFLDGDAGISNRLSKKRKSIRGASKLQLPTVVMAIGFAVGTTSDDIRQSLKMTTNETGGFDTSRTIEAINCNIVSVGPRVIARLVFPTKADAEKVVDEWNDAEVDGSDLALWITDDEAGVKPKEEAVISPFTLMAAPKSRHGSSTNTPGSVVNWTFGATATNGASATGVSPVGIFGVAQKPSSGFNFGCVPDNKGTFEEPLPGHRIGRQSVFERLG
jgi:hypothetical protein